ncbi:hypothetical protein A5906_23320 [Bradyrhizobium sacchari]|nr:hypothetical protein A5906_23320 [Bradyrhizobium sacchari]
MAKLGEYMHPHPDGSSLAIFESPQSILRTVASDDLEIPMRDTFAAAGRGGRCDDEFLLLESIAGISTEPRRGHRMIALAPTPALRR